MSERLEDYPILSEPETLQLVDAAKEKAIKLASIAELGCQAIDDSCTVIANDAAILAASIKERIGKDLPALELFATRAVYLGELASSLQTTMAEIIDIYGNQPELQGLAVDSKYTYYATKPSRIGRLKGLEARAHLHTKKCPTCKAKKYTFVEVANTTVLNDSDTGFSVVVTNRMERAYKFVPSGTDPSTLAPEKLVNLDDVIIEYGGEGGDGWEGHNLQIDSPNRKRDPRDFYGDHRFNFDLKRMSHPLIPSVKIENRGREILDLKEEEYGSLKKMRVDAFDWLMSPSRNQNVKNNLEYYIKGPLTKLGLEDLTRQAGFSGKTRNFYAAEQPDTRHTDAALIDWLRAGEKYETYTPRMLLDAQKLGIDFELWLLLDSYGLRTIVDGLITKDVRFRIEPSFVKNSRQFRIL